MADLKQSRQTSSGATGGVTHPKGDQEQHDTGAEFGTSERATRGTNRDADRTGESKNQGHGHPREERADNDG